MSVQGEGLDADKMKLTLVVDDEIDGGVENGFGAGNVEGGFGIDESLCPRAKPRF